MAHSGEGPVGLAGLAGLAAGLPTDKNTVHSYLPVYDGLLARLRDSASAVLEVGIYHGGSIRLWQRFFGGAAVFGADIIPPAEGLAELPRVRTFQGDAYDTGFLEGVLKPAVSEFGGKFDFIIDDGPHTLESMLFAATHFPALLKPDGILIVEDVQSPSWVPSILAAFPEEDRMHARAIDLRHVKGRYDDLLVVLDRDPKKY
jgi:SAM-dependent methyltransferase